MNISRKSRIKFFTGVALLSLTFGSAQIGVANTQNLGVPLTLQEALASLEMEKNSKDFKYKTAVINDKKAVFTDVTIVEKDTKARAKTVTLSRRPIDNRFVLTFDSASLGEKTGEINVGQLNFVFREIADGKRKVLEFKKPDGENAFNADINANNIVVNLKQEKMKIALKSFAMDNFDSRDGFRFDDLRLNGMGFASSGMNFKIGKIELGGLSDYIFDKINEKKVEIESGEGGMAENTGLVGTGLDFFQNAEIGKFLVEGVEITQQPTKTKKKTKEPNSFDYFKLAKFEIRNFNSNKIDRFAISGIDFKAKADNAPFFAKLGEFSFDNFRFDFFKTLMTAYFTANEDENAEKIRSIKLSDLLKKGPLDLTLSAFNFNNFHLSAAGVEMKVDRMGYHTLKEENGFITEAEMPDGSMEFDMSKANGLAKTVASQAKPDSLPFDKFKMSYGYHASYDPKTDVLTSDKTNIVLENLFSVKSSGKSGGVLNWLQNTSVGDILDASPETMPKDDSDASEEVESSAAAAVAAAVAAAAATATPMKTNSEREINDGQVLRPVTDDALAEIDKPDLKDIANPETLETMLEKWKKLYNGVKILSLNIEVMDLGILDFIAREESVDSGESPRKIRENWAKEWELTQEEQKDSPQFLRDAVVVIGNFIKKGGAIKFNLENEKGVEFKDFMSLDADHKALGFNISN